VRAQLDHILGRYGTFIVERAGSDVEHAVEHLARWRHNIHLISQLIQNDVSSTKARPPPFSAPVNRALTRRRSACS
jgi:nicotinamide mononucleotide adenylyltransferase